MRHSSPSSFLRVLIADDDPGSAGLLKQVLAAGDTGYQFDMVRDGAEALDFLHKRGIYRNAVTPDLVLLDLDMPKASGFDVLYDVKSHTELRRVIVIVFSTSTDSLDVNRAYNCGANCYISKPTDLAGYIRLAEAIRNFWGRWAALPSRACAAHGS